MKENFNVSNLLKPIYLKTNDLIKKSMISNNGENKSNLPLITFKNRLETLNEELELSYLNYFNGKNEKESLNTVLNIIHTNLNTENKIFTSEIDDLVKSLNSVLKNLYELTLNEKNKISLLFLKESINELFSKDNDLKERGLNLLKVDKFNINDFFIKFIELKDQYLSRYNYTIEDNVKNVIKKVNEYLTDYGFLENKTNFYDEINFIFRDQIYFLIKKYSLKNYLSDTNYNILINKLITFFKNFEPLFSEVQYRSVNVDELLVKYIQDNELEVFQVITNYNFTGSKSFINCFFSTFNSIKKNLLDKNFHPNLIFFSKILDYASTHILEKNTNTSKQTALYNGDIKEFAENLQIGYYLYEKFLIFNKVMLNHDENINDLIPYSNTSKCILRDDLTLLMNEKFFQHHLFYFNLDINNLTNSKEEFINCYLLVKNTFNKYFLNYKYYSKEYIKKIFKDFSYSLSNLGNYKQDELTEKKENINWTENFEIENINNKIYGMDNVKKTLFKNIKIAKYNKNGFKISPTLLIGEPGTGKSYFLKIIAETLKIPFLYFSCNGKEEWTLIGQEKSWRGSKIGAIAEFMEQNGCPKNAIIILDEIDKHSKSQQVNFPSALSLLLDENLNKKFIDNNNHKEYDLSGISFFMTSNDINLNGAGFNQNVFPEYLMSRLTLIKVPSYSVEEKLYIIKNIMYSKIFNEFDFNENDDFYLNDDILKYIIEKANESGLRQIEKIIKNIYKEYIFLKIENNFTGFEFEVIKPLLTEIGISEEEKIKIGF